MDRSMEPSRWEQVQAIFHDAADLPVDQQQVFVERASAGDADLAAAVMGLLAEDARSGSLIDRGLAGVARDVLAVPVDRRLTQIGPYTVIRQLGEGGMGVVYLARRDDLGREVAVKVLRDATLSPARQQRFASEQRTLAQLTHPSIARFYEADVLSDGTPWFAMEYVEGATLTEHCRAHACSIGERLRLFRAVCEAVQFAHRHLVIHRDLKPSNILVTAEGAVRLLDFGIAKQLEAGDDTADRTRTELRMMTPNYAAPEQLRGEPVGVQSDVYSLGVILYELLTGRRPFDLARCTPREAERVVTEQDPTKPSTAGGGSAILASKATWSDLDVLCLKALHKDPVRRYASVEALIRDLDHFQRGEPLDARPDSLSYRARKFVTRHHRGVIAASLVMIGVTALVAFYTIRLTAARNAAVAEAARTQLVQRFMLTLFEGGETDVAPASELRVLSLLDRGVKEARSLDSSPDLQAELQKTLGTIYQRLGSYDQADRLLREALDRRRALYPGDRAEVAESLIALGLLRTAQAKLDEAEQLVREGLRMSRATLPAGHPGLARATAALGKVLEERGDYKQALPILQEAVQRYQAAPTPLTAEMIAAMSELANTHFFLGELEASESLNRQVLDIDRQLQGEAHPRAAEALLNLGAIEAQRGRHEQEERDERQALGILRAWYGPDHPECASAMAILAQALIAQGPARYAEADELLRGALTIQEHVHGLVHPRVAFVLNELGTLHFRRQQWDDAEAEFRRTLAIYRTAYGNKSSRVGVALANLGSVAIAREDYAKAEPLMREAIEVDLTVLAPDHLNIAIARVKLGHLLVRQLRYAEAEPHLLAGYTVLARQAAPSPTWLKTARTDLVTVYDEAKQPQKAEKFRAELAATLVASK